MSAHGACVGRRASAVVLGAPHASDQDCRLVQHGWTITAMVAGNVARRPAHTWEDREADACATGARKSRSSWELRDMEAMEDREALGLKVGFFRGGAAGHVQCQR